MYVNTGVEAKGQHQISSSIILHLVFVVQVPSLNLVLGDLARPASQQAPSVLIHTHSASPVPTGLLMPHTAKCISFFVLALLRYDK